MAARRITAAMILLGTFSLTLAPWAIRNTRIQGTFVPVDTMGGRNFMMGNYRYTPLYRSWDAISIEGTESWIHELTSFPPEMRNTQAKLDRLAMRQGLRFVCDNPWLTLQRDIVKFFDFWGLERGVGGWAKPGKGFGEICLASRAVLCLALRSFSAVTSRPSFLESTAYCCRLCEIGVCIGSSCC